MEAIEVYRGLQFELDRYEAPMFSIPDFNYHINVAVDEYVDTNADAYDIGEKDLEDIRVLISEQVPLTITAGKGVLPTDLRRITSCLLQLEILSDNRELKKGGVHYVYSAKWKSDQAGFRKENAYLSPAPSKAYHKVAGSSLIFYTGSSKILGCQIEYIKQPPKIYLNPVEPLNGSLSFPSVFPPYATREIIKLCARKFIENTESARYRTQVSEKSLRNE